MARFFIDRSGDDRSVDDHWNAQSLADTRNTGEGRETDEA
jgi:hypothetical protein